MSLAETDNGTAWYLRLTQRWFVESSTERAVRALSGPLGRDRSGDRYSQVSDFYSRLHSEWWNEESSELRAPPERLIRVFRLLTVIRPDSLLEVGFENPARSLKLKQWLGVSQLELVDIDRSRVDRARGVGLSALTVDVSSSPLPYPAGTFDVVLMTEVVEHLFDPDYALGEIARVLKHGGQLILTTPNLASWYNRALLLVGIQPIGSEVSTRRVYGRRFSQLGEGKKPVGHIRLFTLSALKQLLNDSGFCQIEAKGYSDGRIPLDRAFSRVPWLASGFIVTASPADRKPPGRPSINPLPAQQD